MRNSISDTRASVPEGFVCPSTGHPVELNADVSMDLSKYFADVVSIRTRA